MSHVREPGLVLEMWGQVLLCSAHCFLDRSLIHIFIVLVIIVSLASKVGRTFVLVGAAILLGGQHMIPDLGTSHVHRHVDRWSR